MDSGSEAGEFQSPGAFRQTEVALFLSLQNNFSKPLQWGATSREANTWDAVNMYQGHEGASRTKKPDTVLKFEATGLTIKENQKC